MLKRQSSQKFLRRTRITRTINSHPSNNDDDDDDNNNINNNLSGNDDSINNNTNLCNTNTKALCPLYCICIHS